MTSGQPAGPSAAKLGGFALIGVGALAAVFGVATVVSGDTSSAAKDPGGVAAGPTTSAVASTSAGGGNVTPSSTGGRPSESSHRTPSPSKPKPSDSPRQPGGTPQAGKPDTPDVGARPGSGGQVGGDRAGATGGQPGTQRQIVLRVYNNSKIRGLAHRAAADFRAAGYRVAEIGNYSGGRIPVTTIYYRPGTPEKAQARIVADRFGARVEPRFPGISDASAGVIAIVTKNYDGPETGK